MSCRFRADRLALLLRQTHANQRSFDRTTRGMTPVKLCRIAEETARKGARHDA
jgi:hypothetical protein